MIFSSGRVFRETIIDLKAIVSPDLGEFRKCMSVRASVNVVSAAPVAS